MIAALFGCVLAQSFEVGAPRNDPTVTLATYSIAGKEIAATVPADSGPFPSFVRGVNVGGWRHLVDERGRFVRRTVEGGGWEELRQLFAQAHPKVDAATPVWRVKAIVLNRMDVLDRGPGGMLRVRRNTFDPRHTDRILRSLARLCAMIEAYSGGRLRAKVDVEFDTDWARLDAVTIRGASLSDFFVEVATPRVNGGRFEPEDRVYRGPYDSVFCIHSGLFEQEVRAEVWGMPLAAIPSFLSGDGYGEYGLTFALFDHFCKDLEFALGRQGFQANGASGHRSATCPEIEQGFLPRANPSEFFGDLNWGKARAWETPDGATYADHRTPSGPMTAAEARAQGLSKLPRLVEDLGGEVAGMKLAVSADGSSFAFRVEGAAGEPQGVDGRLEFGREAFALVTAGAKRLLIADAEFLDLAASLFPPEERRLLARHFDGSGACVIFDATGLPDVTRESEWFANRLEGDHPATLGASGAFATGTYSLAKVQDAERGQALELRAGPFPRRGAVWLIGGPGASLPFDASRAPFLTFWIRSSKPEPMELKVHGPSGRIGSVALFGRLQTPEEASPTSTLAQELAVDPDSAWKRVVIDLRKIAAPGSALEVTGISIGSHPFAGCWEVTQPASEPVIWITSPEFSVSASDPETPMREAPSPRPDDTSVNPFDRALFAASAGTAPDPQSAERLIRLLSDAREVVRLNAAAAFRKVVDPRAEAQLTNLSRGLDPRTCEQAIAALIAQGTASALDSVKRTLEIGPYDYCREFAARALGARGEPSLLLSATALVSAKSWRARAAGAEVIGSLAGDAAERALMIFLYETDPAVRLAATRKANPASEQVCRRLLWSAVNDASDAVRAASYRKLLDSPIPTYAAEGAKGVRDDSVPVRLSVLDHIIASPKAAHRAALQLAVSDVDPRVRTAALRAFAVLPGEVTLEELGRAATDDDPRVREAMRDLAKAKGIALPPPGNESRGIDGCGRAMVEPRTEFGGEPSNRWGSGTRIREER